MRLPRWTTYPALAVIGVLVVTAVPRGNTTPQNEGAALRARAAYQERLEQAARSQRVELESEAQPQAGR